MSEIKVGDVVELKSGSPKMTVSLVGRASLGGEVIHAWCDWFEGPKKISDNFPLTSLKIVNPGV